VRDVELCEAGYNPRFDALEKHYRYVLHAGRDRDPLLRRQAWSLGRSRQLRREFTRDDDAVERLDLAAMRDAASHLVGTHDFRAFRSADDDRKVTTRTMFSIDVVERFADHPGLVSIEVRGNAFMKNMVRILAGTLVEVGRGRMAPSRIDHILGPEGRREDAGVTAPAHGLTLVSMRLGRLRELGRLPNGAPIGNTA
jgi:tRNA pseudouridine38-40 synthase